MRLLLPTLLFTIALPALATEVFYIPVKKFEIKTSNALKKIERALDNPNAILERFSPEGAQISRKSIETNKIKFIATKKVLFVSKTVWVKGVFNITDSSQICEAHQIGYSMTLDLIGSDELVYDNIDRLEAQLCLTEHSQSRVGVSIKGMIFKGANYSSITGGMARNVISSQIDPIIKAVNEEVNSYKN